MGATSQSVMDRARRMDYEVSVGLYIEMIIIVIIIQSRYDGSGWSMILSVATFSYM